MLLLLGENEHATVCSMTPGGLDAKGTYRLLFFSLLHCYALISNRQARPTTETERQTLIRV